MKKLLSEIKKSQQEISDEISQKYPADWNMDSSFEKSWSKYQGMEKSENDISDFENSKAEISENGISDTPKKISVRNTVMYTAEAVACFAIMFLLARKIYFLPEPPEEESKVTVTATSASETLSTEPEKSTCHTTKSAEITTEKSVIPEETVSEIYSQTDISEDYDIYEITETTIAEETVSSEPTTVTTQTTISSTLKTETTSASVTTTITSQNEPELHEDGFVWSGNLLEYRQYAEINPVYREHHFSADGFSESVSYGDDGEIFLSITDDEAEQGFIVTSVPHQKFSMRINNDSRKEIIESTINGRPAIIISPDDEEAVCTIVWNDGCHISTIIGQKKYIDTMLMIADKL